jgi:hypothetical protein
MERSRVDTRTRHAYLDKLIESTDSDQVRLRALELRERLAEREPGRERNAEAEFVEHYADDPERLVKLIGRSAQHR